MEYERITPNLMLERDEGRCSLYFNVHKQNIAEVCQRIDNAVELSIVGKPLMMERAYIDLIVQARRGIEASESCKVDLVPFKKLIKAKKLMHYKIEHNEGLATLCTKVLNLDNFIEAKCPGFDDIETLWHELSVAYASLKKINQYTKNESTGIFMYENDSELTKDMELAKDIESLVGRFERSGLKPQKSTAGLLIFDHKLKNQATCSGRMQGQTLYVGRLKVYGTRYESLKNSSLIKELKNYDGFSFSLDAPEFFHQADFLSKINGELMYGWDVLASPDWKERLFFIGARHSDVDKE